MRVMTTTHIACLTLAHTIYPGISMTHGELGFGGRSLVKWVTEYTSLHRVGPSRWTEASKIQRIWCVVRLPCQDSFSDPFLGSWALGIHDKETLWTSPFFSNPKVQFHPWPGYNKRTWEGCLSLFSPASWLTDWEGFTHWGGSESGKKLEV